VRPAGGGRVARSCVPLLPSRRGAKGATHDDARPAGSRGGRRPPARDRRGLGDCALGYASASMMRLSVGLGRMAAATLASSGM